MREDERGGNKDFIFKVRKRKNGVGLTNNARGSEKGTDGKDT